MMNLNSFIGEVSFVGIREYLTLGRSGMAMIWTALCMFKLAQTSLRTLGRAVAVRQIKGIGFIASDLNSTSLKYSARNEDVVLSQAPLKKKASSSLGCIS